MQAEEFEGWKLEYRDYLTMIDGRPVVVERVPYSVDPQTGEAFLHASVAEKLYAILHDRPRPARQVLSDVYEWSGLDKAS